MKKYFVYLTLLACTGFLLVNSTYAGEDATTAFGQLKAELENKGMHLKDINNAAKPIKEMLSKGATKEELKKVMLDLKEKEVTGKDLKESLNSMNDLVKDGESPKKAGNIVAQAAQQAKAQGLKGKELAAKVHEAIKQRKTEREQLKTRLREEKGGIKGESIQLRTEKEVEERMMNEQHGMSIGKGQGRGKKK